MALHIGPHASPMARRLPLHSWHEARGAVLRRVGDWELPAHYGDALKEYQAASEGAAVADISHWGKLVFTGSDSLEFLQGLVTNDLKNTGSALPACFLTPKGKLVAEVFFVDRGDDMLCLAEPLSAAAFSQGLAKFLPLSNTTMQDVGQDFCLFHLLGPKAAELLAEVVGEAGSSRAVAWQGGNIWVAPWPKEAGGGCMVVVPRLAGGDILKKVSTQGALPAGFDALETLRVERGAPRLGIDADGENFPVEVNLGHTINYDKGCYLGQETMARLRTYGRATRRLVGLKLPDLPPLDSPVTSRGEVVGKISSAARSPRLSAPLALAMVKSAEPGAPLAVVISGKETPAQEIPLPLREIL